MKRPTIIASVVAATGVLIAGSVAATALVNAASSSTADTATASQVGEDHQLVPAALVTEPASIDPLQSAPAADLPDIASPKASATPDEQSPVADQGPVVITAENTPEARASQPSGVTAAKAKALVRAATPGQVVDVASATRQGAQAWAITLERTDGSVVTGYVDRATGVIVDWKLVQKATPQPVVNASAAYDEEEDDREDYNDDAAYDEDSGDEYENGDNDDDEGDDDDD